MMTFTPAESMLAAIEHLRSACEEMIEAHPCLTPEDNTCHCPTCITVHAMACTGGYAKTYCYHCQEETGTRQVDCEKCKLSKTHDNQGKVFTDSDFGTLEKRVRDLHTVKRGNCRDCGNPWWSDMPQSWVCTTCNKTHGKSNSEMDNWRPK